MKMSILQLFTYSCFFFPFTSRQSEGNPLQPQSTYVCGTSTTPVYTGIHQHSHPTQNLQRKNRTDSQMNPGLMKIGVWTVRCLYGKEKLLQEELKKKQM